LFGEKSCSEVFRVKLYFGMRFPFIRTAQGNC